MSSVLRQPLVLPEDVLVTPVAEMPEELRGRIGGEEGDFAVSRPRSRASSVVVDADAAALLDGFRIPRTIVQAVLVFSRDRGVDPENALEQALPLLRQLISSRLLLPQASGDSDSIRATLESGERFAGYAVLRPVQVLEDSELYQARAAAGEVVALKTARPGHEAALRPHLAREAAALRRLAGAAASPRLVEFREEGGRPFLALSWCRGVDVGRAAAEARVAGDRGELLGLLTSVAGAYATLHQAGVVHGDVHVGNALVDRDGAVTLLDFGLAGRIGEEPPAAQRGGVSFFYEPEWARALLAGEKVPPATALGEQYGVAALIYLLATGSHYAEFKLDSETMPRQIAELPPRPFEETGTEPWPALEAVLERAFDKLPQRRYPKMADFAKALAGVDLPAAMAAPAVDPAGPRLVAELLDELDPDGPLFDNGLPAGPVCSVNLGAAGIAYALYRIACVRDDSGLLAASEIWIARALADCNREDAFTNPALELTAEVTGRVSPYHSGAGIELVRALIARATGDRGELAAAVSGFVDASREPCPQWDLVLGRCGTVLGCALLIEDGLEAAGVDVEPLRALGEERLAEIWEETRSFGPVADCAELPNLGIAHGWAGLLYVTLRWHVAADRDLPTRFGERLAQLAGCARPSGRGLEMPWRERPGDAESSMPGWCNGSAGLVHLGALAYRILGDEAYRSLATGAAWDAWEGGDGLVDLCCGLAGRAYALLAQHELSGDGAWLERASRLARRAARLAPDQRTPEHPRHSLYKGELGLVLLLAELESHESACMPLFSEQR